MRASLIERAANPGAPVAVPRPAASVVLLREHEGALQTYLLHRHARMAFAASMVAFPGGGVDPGDHEAADVTRACAVRETSEETGVRLGVDDLMRWAHWITPTPEPRRYDTVFFLAALPFDQEAADVSGETDRAEWSTAAGALTELAAGRIAMLPPTLSILTELAELTDLAAVREAAADRHVVTVVPEVVRTDAGWAYRYPVGS